MAKHLNQVNVNLAFTAEAKQAKQVIEDLNKDLRKIQLSPTNILDEKTLGKAVKAAQDLEVHLQKAVNVDTGKLDLNKFSQSLSKSGQNLSQLHKDLVSAGAAGERAFVNLVRSINTAESQTLNLSNRFKEFGTTLKNTLRWELSSKIMHGLESGISSAYRYAQNLNESLNDIRIVTGYSSDQMAKFAEQANKAAKALSTTTTEYTDASLIFYQQGLPEDQIAERTEATIKMANATRQSAQTVSDQMTAIWNNFDDGSKSVEYYADVLTQLGAVTASSTDEISDGVQKFAAVADTVGLSYEYATSALATVTATTRESADVVGTAFKTLFARIQGLNLGETLDDGTTLNKYSEALNSVGISIFEQNGQMKDMNNILDEMGSKWSTLSKDQQTALAQTVAGVRQYTQLVALMDNWDFFQSNVKVAKGAEGTLDKQAEIYAESWEAAADRVQASLEGIYQDILDDDLFISALNGMDKFIGGVDRTIESMGGLKNILVGVSGIVLTNYAKEMPSAIEKLTQNFNVLTGQAEKAKQAMLNQAMTDINKVQGKSSSREGQIQLETLKLETQMTVELNAKRKMLSQSEQQAYETKIKQIRSYGESAAALAKETDQLQKQNKIIIEMNARKAAREAANSHNEEIELAKWNIEQQEKQLQLAEEYHKAYESRKSTNNFNDTQYKNLAARYEQEIAGAKKGKDSGKTVEALRKELEEAKKVYNEAVQSKNNAYKKMAQETKENLSNYVELNKKYGQIQSYLDSMGDNSGTFSDILEDAEKLRGVIQTISGEIDNTNTVAFKDLQQVLSNTDASAEELANALKTYLSVSLQSAEEHSEDLRIALHQAGMSFEELDALASGGMSIGDLEGKLGNIISRFRAMGEEGVKSTGSVSRGLTTLSGAVMSLLSSINSLKNLGGIWNDDDLSKGEKILQTLMTVVPLLGAFSELSQLATIKTDLFTTATWKQAAAQMAANWQLTLAVAAIGLLVGAVVLLANSYDDTTEKIQKAEESLKYFEEELTKSKQYAQELKSAFDEYDEVKNTLDECVKGTEEWNLALEKNNETVLELLKNYPELKTMFNDSGENAISFSKDGYKIEDWAIKNLQDIANERVTNDYASTTFKEQEIRDLRIQESRENIIGSLSSYNSEQIEAIANKALDYALNNPEKDQDQINKYIEQLFSELGNQDSLKMPMNELKMAIGDNVNEIDNLRVALKENTIALETENKILASNYLQNNEKITNSAYSDEILNIVGKNIQNLQNKEEAKTSQTNLAKQSGVNQMTGTNKSAEKYFEEWLSAKGLSNAGYKLTDTSGSYKNRVYHYEDEQGNSLKVTLESMLEDLTAYNLNATINEFSDKMLGLLENLQDKAYSDATLNLLGQDNFYNLTSSELNSMFESYDKNRSGLVESEEITSRLMEDFNTDEAGLKELFGAETLDEIANRWVSAFENSYQSFGDIINYINSSVIKDMYQELDSSLEVKDLDLNQRLGLVKQLEEAYYNSGKEGATALKDVFINTIDSEKDELVDVLSSIDWQTTDIDKLRETLRKAGVSTEFTDTALQGLIDSLRKISDLSFDSVSTNYKNVHEIITDLEKGDKISTEDFKILQDSGIENIEKFFRRMADGSYELKSDAEKFYDFVHEQTIQQFQDLKEQESIKGTAASNVINNTGGTQTRIDLLKFSGIMTSEEDQALLRDMETKGFNLQDEKQKEISERLQGWIKDQGGYNEVYKAMEESSANLTSTLFDLNLAIATSYTDMDDLKKAYEEGKFSAEAFTEAAIRLEEAADLEGIDNKELKEYKDYIQNIAESSEELDDSLVNNEEATEDVAKSIIKMNRGIETLSSNFDDWKDVLKKSTKQSKEYYEAMEGTREALSDVLDVNEEFISDDFIAENLDLITKAAKGSADAIDSLREKLGQKLILDITVQNGFNETAQQEILAEFQSLQDMLPDLNLQVGATLNDGEFLTKAQELISSANMTVDQANAVFDALGFEATFVTEEQPVQKTGRGTRTVYKRFEDETVTLPDGSAYTIPGGYESYTYPGSPYTYVDYVEVPAMATSVDGKTKTPQIKSITKKATGSFNNFSPSNPGGKPAGGGGSSSKPKAYTKTKKSDVVERYKEINNSLEDVADAISDNNKQLDRMYGQGRINALEKSAELHQKEAELIRKKIEEAKKYLEIDKKLLLIEAQRAGISFTFDDDGSINNQTEQLEKLYNELARVEDQAQQSNFRTGDAQNKFIENHVEPVKEKIEALRDAIADYEETLQLIRDTENSLDDAFYNWQSDNFETINAKLELELDINDLELREIEYYTNKIKDDFWGMAEGATYLIKKLSDLDIKSFATGQDNSIFNGPLIDNIETYKAYNDTLKAAYNDNKISQADYIKGMKEAYNGIMDNLEAIQELDDEMLHYYEDTLAAALEELDYYTGQLEHLTSVLDHYKNIVELIDGEFNYEAIGEILQGQTQTIQNELNVLTANYNMLLGEKAAIEASLAQFAPGDAGREVLENDLKAITEAVNEAQDEMLSKTEQWIEAMKAVVQNRLDEISYSLEMAFTKDLGFDYLNKTLDRVGTYNEEYLTDVNKIYETQKIINTVQQEIDKTTNEAAKIRLKNYIEETKKLQNKNELSKLDLEIQKAKYDLLLAEIALEEAQRAKSTVRLQRDNEGNFGYVYTADAEAISSAEQDLLDAQNALYNIGLEATNEYGQKRLELQQQYYEDEKQLQEDYMNGRFASEEAYEKARDELQKQYYDLFTIYSKNYTTALEVDSSLQKDAWITNYEDMMMTTEEWSQISTDAIKRYEEVNRHWRDEVKEHNETVKRVLEDTKSAVSEVTAESSNLAQTVTNEIIPAMSHQLESVRQVTMAYAQQRQELMALVDGYEEYLAQLKSEIITQSNANLEPYDPNADYSRLLAEHLRDGGQVGDAKYNQLMKYRDQKMYGDNSGVYLDNNELQKIFEQYDPNNKENKVTIYVNNIAAGTQGLFFTEEELKRQGISHLLGFASGGYTGAWGPDGRLAMLHEKELVLNSQDTTNFLTATQIIRDVAKMIDLEALSNQFSLNAMMTNLDGYVNTQPLEQIVQIEASFPGVVDRYEIEEAIRNLSNTASQYANRK